MIKAIVFDYFGVISPQGIIPTYLKQKFPSPEARLQTLDEYCEKWDIGDFNYQDFNDKLAEITEISSDSIWPTFFKNREAFQDIVDIIKKLKNNYKIILFSNNCAGNLRRLLKQQGIDVLFDEIIISSEHHLVKPDPKFYELMLSIAKVDASEAIFIDDHQKNVDAGNNLGIKSLLFTDAATLKNDLINAGIKLE